MVRRNGFFKDSSGAALTEGLIVFPLMLLSIIACVEFSYGMFQWNQAAKAMQLGARKAVVSDPLTNDFADVFAFDDSIGGTVVVADPTRQSVCVAGGDNCNAAALAPIIAFMQGFNPNITAQNLRITYQHNGLGYEGRPGGPVVSVKFELTNLPLDLPLIGVFLNIANIVYPPFPVSATTEDLNSNSGS